MSASSFTTPSMERPRIDRARFIFTATILVVLIPLWYSQISGSRIVSDPTAYVQMSANLIRHGVISLDSRPPFRPSMYREPVPIFTTTLAMSIIDSVLGQAEVSDYLQGERARYLKLQNIFWMLVLLASTAWAIHLLTGSIGFALGGALLAHLPFYSMEVAADGHLDSLATEIPAAAALMVGCAALVAAYRGQRKLLFLAVAGLAFGVMALIKAAFLYVFIGFVGVLLAGLLFKWFRQRLQIGFAGVAVLAMGFAAVVAPWLYRNWQQFGVVQIAERAGAVLTIRAVKNGMNAVEYRGSFYAWAPRPTRPLVGSVLGFGPQDLMRGGPLQRLNRSSTADFYADDLAAERAGKPEAAISYYRKSRAERVKLRNEFRAMGSPQPEIDADAVLMDRALTQIREHPWRHLATTIPFLWRGAFIPFPLLACSLAYALVRRRYELALFVLPSFGMVMFYALLSHFIMRYSVPTLPVALASATVLACIAWRTLRQRSGKIIVTPAFSDAPAK